MKVCKGLTLGMSKKLRKNNTKLRVGILTHNYPLKSGESKDAGKFIFSFAQELAKKNKVFVLCPFYKGEKEAYKKIPVTWFKWNGGKEKFGTWKLYDPRTVFKFYRLIYNGRKAALSFVDRHNLDILLCFWNFPSGVFANHVKEKLGIPYVTWALGSDIYIYPKFPIVRQMTQGVLKNADKCFGNSYDICKNITKLARVNADFLPTSNAVNTGESVKPKLSSTGFNFLFLGRLEKVKGPDILLEGASILAKKGKSFTITMIGGGSLESELKENLRNLNLEHRVFILGYVEDQKVVNGYLKTCDALVIPSRSESFPLVVTEALQVGLPMIGSDVGDMPAFIGRNKLGFIFPREDPKALARTMEKMIKVGRKIKKDKKKLMKKLSNEFKLSSITNKFLSNVI